MTTNEKLRIKAVESMGWPGPWRFGNIHLHGTSPDGRANKDVPECIDVPVQSPTEEKTHTDIVDVVACITCGVCERTVYRYKASDVKKRIKKMTTSENLRIKAAESMGWTGPWRFGNIHLHGTSPDGRANKDVPECIDGIIKDLCYKVDTLSTGIKAVRSLINESQGVAGLHLNGDIVEWSELEAGGRSEEWLGDLNYSEDAITEKGELKK